MAVRTLRGSVACRVVTLGPQPDYQCSASGPTGVPLVASRSRSRSLAASVALHEACGFDHLGTMREVGRKFDRWIDTAWYQLTL